MEFCQSGNVGTLPIFPQRNANMETAEINTKQQDPSQIISQTDGNVSGTMVDVFLNVTWNIGICCYI